MRGKFISFILLLLIFALALFFRVYFCYDKVFSEQIKYASDDGVYHMRLVENELLGNHFPYRIYFDPYTNFPYGTYHYFAPLYDQLLAGTIWLVGFGQPTLELVNKIAPFYPAVLGSLMVFLVYFIAKVIWDRKVGFLSALLMAVSSPYLFRSLLGATDHHVAEVLFSTLAMMFLIFALKTRDQKRKFWLFTFLAGLSLGLYFLNWAGALLFLFIISTFIVLYYLISYLSRESPDWILFMGVFIFLITLIMIAPFFGHPDIFHANIYNIQHLEVLIFGIAGFIFIGISGKFFIKKGINPRLFPVFLILIAVLFLSVLKLGFPLVYEGIVKSVRAVRTGVVPHELARQIIGEMRPLRLQGAIDNFSSLFYLSLIALGIIIYQFIKKRKPEHLLILVWTFVILLMTGIIPFFGQQRFSYYLACNISLLSGFLIVKGFEFGWRGLRACQRVPLKTNLRPYFLVGTLLIIFNIIFFTLYPFPFNIGESYPKTLPYILQTALNTAKGGPPSPYDDWYESLKWLKENTPDPGLDYYSLYKEPGLNLYPYSEKAYGVLARWDVGHMITYYSHRIPNSNPFQQGIGRKKEQGVEELGEVIFFLETDEKKAAGYLDTLKTRYVITDYESAHPKGSFLAKIRWAQGNFEGYYLEGQEPDSSLNRFDNSMIVRLHILDGRGETTERELKGEKINFYIKPLDQFRLIYESESQIIYSPESYKDDIKAVKVFEYVKGAKIVGQVKTGTEVFLSTEIETNQGRKFVYQKSAKATQDSFEFIVPYAQSYKLKIKDKEIEVNVSEEDVLEGRIVEI